MEKEPIKLKHGDEIELWLPGGCICRFTLDLYTVTYKAKWREPEPWELDTACVCTGRFISIPLQEIHQGTT